MKSLSATQYRPMFSRQGKAISHMYPTYFAKPIKRSPPKEKEDFPDIIIEGLNEESKEDIKKPSSASKIKTNMSSSFKAISRAKYEFTYRNKTESPNSTSYNPNWQAIRPRSAQAPRISNKKTKPRIKKIFTPNCLTKDLNCSFPIQTSPRNAIPGSYIDKLKRTMSNMHDYIEKAEGKQSKTETEPIEQTLTATSFVSFEKQLTRKEFVSQKDPPHPKRFTFLGVSSNNYSKNKKVRSFLFSKSSKRKELFTLGLTIGPYKKDEEKLMPKLNTSQLDFSKMTDRKELVNEHMLQTPNSPYLKDYDKAYCKQSTVRGPFSIPLMSTTTPRDDLMYRTTEAYTLNVPEIQSADAVPKFNGDVSIKAFKATL